MRHRFQIVSHFGKKAKPDRIYTERTSKMGISAAPKPRGSTARLSPHIRNMGRDAIVELRELSRRPKSNFSSAFGIFSRLQVESGYTPRFRKLRNHKDQKSTRLNSS